MPARNIATLVLMLLPMTILREAMADAFYKDSVPSVRVKLGEGYKDWSEIICDQFVKENPGSLWGSKFPNILIHKKNHRPLHNVSSWWQRFPGSHSRYGNYYVTFNKVSHPSMAKAIVKKMAALTKSVIAAFSRSEHQCWCQIRRRTTRNHHYGPVGSAFVVFQHKIAALNKKLPPSIASRRAKAEKAKAKATKAEAKSPPSEPEHDGDDHDDPGTNAEGNADSSEASGDRQDEQPQPTATSHNSDVDMSGDSDPPGPDNNGKTNNKKMWKCLPTNRPLLLPPNEQPMNSLDLQLVTGYRSGPAPKRTLPSSHKKTWNSRLKTLQCLELCWKIQVRHARKRPKAKRRNNDLTSLRPHLELAKKIIRDKKVEGSITECQRILRDDPQLSLVATKTIERKMVLLKAQGKPHNYKHHVNFMAQSKIHPAEILEELTTDIPEIKRILFALATALTVLLNQEATRLPDNCLTDWSLFALIENFSDNLEKFTLPAPVLSAISMLKSITNNYHIDELCSKAHHFMNADEIDPLDWRTINSKASPASIHCNLPSDPSILLNFICTRDD
ncbi:hypothetical protein Ae201684P_013136 [Aphanomyces euteiches]|nr:hypothetical protein Ae201684P_013136 [Aphanomyces euteiches]